MPDVTYTPWRFYVELDNHSPARNTLTGTMDRYTHPVTGTEGIRFTGEAAKIFAKGNVILIIDDGKSAEPHYSAGHGKDLDYCLFHAFPTTTNTPFRADDGRPIDWSNWSVGPSKAYHLKVGPADIPKIGAENTTVSDNITRAREIGSEHGKSAASWFFDGNTDTAFYRKILTGINDCDPEIMDMLPSHGMSGEMADGYSARDLERELGIDPDTETDDFGDVCDAYENGFNSAVETEIARIASEYLR